MNEESKANEKNVCADRVVSCVIYDYELIKFNTTVPLAVQIRQRLNKEGFEFEDDKKISSIANENPKPKGKLMKWYSNEDRATIYKQWLYS